ncbi:MAG: RNA methyltransferase [Planctomycetes bacterium]|nr:RNA methyltransferase [Planctomycetota bacterium]
MPAAPIITSRQNSTVKRARGLARGKDVATAPVMCVEGVRLLEDALAEGVRFDAVLLSPRLDASERGAALHQSLVQSGNPLLHATDPVLESISDAAGSQGVAGLAHKKKRQQTELFPPDQTPLVAVAWGVQDPGNLGTIMRTADAAGATGLITTLGTACPYNTKCIRASMGSIFRLPVIEADDGLPAIDMLREHHVAVIGTSLSDGSRHVDVDLTRPAAIILGSEGEGLPGDVLRRCDQTIRIPIHPKVESLNVASAAAVIFYEAARQRDFKELV